MIDCRRSRKSKHCWNHIKGFLLITSMVFMYESRADSLGIKSNDVNCSQSQTCITCTNKNECSWSLVQQTCVLSKQIQGGFIANNRDHCTQFSVTKKTGIANISHRISVKISNDPNDFISFLRKSKITCYLESLELKATVGNDEIICDPIRIPSTYFLKNTKVVFYHFFVTFDKKQIKFDHDINYYYSIYDHDCGTIEYDNCVTCLWNDSDYKYYLRKCSKSNLCTGSPEIFDKRAINNLKAPLIEDNIQVKCSEMNIVSIEPLYGLWTGGTTVKITVTNHAILVENKTMVVTVAGRNCANPVTINNETITCTIIKSTENGVGKGPVNVVYGFGRNFTVTSAQIFRFVNPLITSISSVCGPVKGGTLLNMTGEYLDVGGAVRVSTGENVTCEGIAVDRNRILCKTGPSHNAITARIKVEYDQNFWMYVENTSFAYSGDPVLDAGQRFEGVVSGETKVPVRGKHFSCMGNASFYVDQDGTRHWTGCRVENDTYMVCRAPRLGPLPARNTAPVALHFGFRVDFMDHVIDLSPQPDYPSFTLYPDPVYANFEINNRSVIVINGHDMDRGYRANDVTVWFRNHTGNCTVTRIARDQIVCELTAPDVVIGDLSEIVVTIGDNLLYAVQKKSTFKKSHFLFFGGMTFVTYGIITTVGIFIFIFLFVGYLVWRSKAKNQNNAREYNSTMISPILELQQLTNKHTANEYR